MNIRIKKMGILGVFLLSVSAFAKGPSLGPCQMGFEDAWIKTPLTTNLGLKSLSINLNLMKLEYPSLESFHRRRVKSARENGLKPGNLSRSRRTLSRKIQQQEYKAREFARLIKEENPEIISLQEVTTRKTLEIFVEKYLGLKYRIVDLENRQIKNNAFLVRGDLPVRVNLTSHLEPLLKRRLDRIEEGKEPEDRPLYLNGLPLMELQAKNSNGEWQPFMVFVGIHLKSLRAGTQDLSAKSIRSQQIQGLFEIIQKYQDSNLFDGVPIVLVGDFNGNLRRNNKAFQRLFNDLNYSEPGLTRWPELYANEGTVYFERGGIKSSIVDGHMIQRRFLNLIISGRIHHWLDRDGTPFKRPRTLEELHRWPSDHRGVSAVFQMASLLDFIGLDPATENLR